MSIDSELKVSTRDTQSRGEARTKFARLRAVARVLPSDVLTAGRLIALLEDYDPEAPIVIEGQYGGFEWVRRTERVPLRLNVNNLEGFGPHERADSDATAEATGVVILVKPGSAAFGE